MDQKQLYEQQVLKEKKTSASSISLGQRESALLKWIQRNDTNALERMGARIAELSIGDGQLSRALAAAFPSLAIDCVEISPTRLEYCRKMAVAVSPSMAERMRFLELNLDTQFDKLERGSYDSAVAIDVLEHVFDPFHFVRHCHQILKPGGALFLRVPNLAYFKRRLAIVTGRLPITSSCFETPGSYQAWKERHGWDGGHLHFFTIDSLAWLLKGEGFQIISWDDVGANGERIRRWWPGMLFGNLAVVARKKDQPDAPAC
jgi:2-polyprenyl-3-methyl-5-hydroxy-6-metoxy-1,4-benzoquinol methylase